MVIRMWWLCGHMEVLLGCNVERLVRRSPGSVGYVGNTLEVSVMKVM